MPPPPGPGAPPTVQTDGSPIKPNPARNGLVMLGVNVVVNLGHTPRYFSTYALPYDYQPDAGEPVEWRRFLESQWGDDAQSVRELQKWFGLILTLETKYQKMLLLIGPPRSGRSTIKDVMTKLIGPRNMAATSAVALSDRFGLEPLIGKSLAVMGDARTGDTHDAAILLDRILRITGCDPVEVNRKGRTILQDVLMRARLVVVSNEMPNFRDNSKAIVSRYLPLLMTKSFEGREDYGLARRLESELPAILNWAIAGRAMLDQDGRFETPQSAMGLLEDAQSIASPVADFIAEECTVRPDATSLKKDVWERWKSWAERSGHKPGSIQLFGRNLRAATNYKITTARPRDDGDRCRVWSGLDLKILLPAGSSPGNSPF
jgi:putative DNA primase/helicase